MTTCRAPRAAPRRCSATAAALPSFSIATGTPKRPPSRSRRSTPASGMFTDVTARPDRWSMVDGTPTPSAAKPFSARPPITRSSCVRTASSLLSSVGSTARRTTAPARSTSPTASFVPPRSTAITWGALIRGLATILGRCGVERQAVQGLSRREGQRPGPDRVEEGAGARPSRRRRPGRLLAPEADAPASPAALAPHRARDHPRRRSGGRGLGPARLPRLPQRREGGQRAPRLAGLRGARAAGRAHPPEPVDDPRPRHRRGPEPDRAPSARTRS